MIRLCNILFAFSFLLLSCDAASFYERHAEGWFWYQDPRIIEEEKKPQDSKSLPQQDKPKTIEEKASEALAAYKKKLEQKLHLALVSPTPSNVEAYMGMQKDMMDRSNRFSQSWQQRVLLRPDLNTETKFPTSQYARHVVEEENRQKKEKTIQSLSLSFGLFYFFKENCSYCKAFAPIVKMFSEKYQWDVLAISLDGSSSDIFEQTQQDNGMAEALNIQSVPALVAYNAETQELIPLSYSPTSLDQLEDNIMTLTGDNK